jgi:hypothetical protein
MKRKLFITAALLCCFGAAYAWFADINGNWKGSIQTPDGNEFPLTYTFKNDNGKLTGSVVNPQGTVDLADGVAKGDSIWFNIDAGGVKVLHNGKYFSAGDSVSMNIDYQGMKFHTTLKRATGS